MTETRRQIALALLTSIGTGSVAGMPFTEDASWWSNADLAFPIETFEALLGRLHSETVAGIHVTPGLVIEQGDHMVVEATSESQLRKGGRYANRYLFLIHFSGDKIREVREYSDTAHAFASFDLGAG